MSDESAAPSVTEPAETAALRELSAAAEAGPWCEEWMQRGIRHLQRNCEVECSNPAHQFGAIDENECRRPARYDGEFIAAAVNHVRAALASAPVPAVPAEPAREADERDPKQCRRCGNWCHYDGWDHVHAWGAGIGSCRGEIRDLDAAAPAPLAETREAAARCRHCAVSLVPSGGADRGAAMSMGQPWQTVEQQEFGCPFIAARACADCDGSCWTPQQTQPEPTAEEYCAGTGHPPYGNDGDAARCYCGERAYPAPAAPTEGETP